MIVTVGFKLFHWQVFLQRQLTIVVICTWTWQSWFSVQYRPIKKIVLEVCCFIILFLSTE